MPLPPGNQLLPRERRIWERFEQAAPFPLDEVTFSVRLGEGQPVPPGTPAWLERDIKALTQKRADAVVRSGQETWILEIKVRASFSALGQLLGYAILYVAEFNPVQPPRLGIVAERTQPDLAGVLSNFGVEIFLVGNVS